MFSDPQFWVAVSFFLFILAIFNPVRKILKSSLDSQISEIKKNIEETENLKNEAHKTLTELETRKNEVQKEIKELKIRSRSILRLFPLSLRQNFSIRIARLFSISNLASMHNLFFISRRSSTTCEKSAGVFVRLSLNISQNVLCIAW